MSALFDSAREAFLNGKISWADGKIRAALLTHKPNTEKDSTLADVAKRIACKSRPLKDCKIVKGAVAAADVSFDEVGTEQISALVLYQEGDTDKASLLIAMIDAMAGMTFPFVPSGGDVQVAWDRGPNKIFKF